MEITGTITAWVPADSPSRQESFIRSLEGGKNDVAIEAACYSNLDMAHLWTKVGTATITIEVDSRDEMIKSQVATLTEKKKRVLAEAQREATQIEGQIQNLLAITFDAEVV